MACSGSAPGGDTDTQEQLVSPEVSACISKHPAGETVSPTVETSAAQCRTNAGTGCDEAFISLEAARCIAQDAQLQAGLEEWTIELSYTYSHRRVVWGIENLLVDDGPDGYTGESLTVDAVSGRVLGRTTWHADQ